MSETRKVEDQNDVNRSKKENKILTRFLYFVREILSILIWGYVIIKLFVFDIDIFIIEKMFPDYVWLVNYKFFILIGILAIIWLVTKNIHILFWSLFIFFYPVILVFWRVPKFLFKKQNWNLIFAFVDSIISFFKSFKISFITTSFFLISTTIILNSTNRVLLWISILFLAIIILIIYIQRLILVFKQSGIYQVYSGIFGFFGDYLQNTQFVAIDDAVKSMSIESMDEEQIQSWIYNVQALVLYNRICLFVSKKLKSYQDSGFNVVSSVLGILFLALFTVFVFATINFGLYKIDANFYSFADAPSFFTFFFYSFNILVFNQIQEVIAATPISQVALMFEYFYILFLFAILVVLVFSIRNQRDADELNKVITHLKEEGIKMEGHIKEKYKLNNISDAMEALQKLRSSLIDFLYKLTDSIA